MRVYPPAWIIPRSAEGDDQIAGYHIPAGSIVIVSPYVTHRDPSLWPEPDTFDPRRFAAAPKETLPRYAYFPFGGGPHLCIGAGFAMMEATLLTAAIARTLRLDAAPGRIGRTRARDEERRARGNNQPHGGTRGGDIGPRSTAVCGREDRGWRGGRSNSIPVSRSASSRATAGT